MTLHEDGHAAVFAMRQKALTRHPNDYLTWLRWRGINLPPLPPPTTDSGRFKGKEFDAWELAYGPKAEPLPPEKPRRRRRQPWYVQFAFGSGSRRGGGRRRGLPGGGRGHGLPAPLRVRDAAHRGPQLRHPGRPGRRAHRQRPGGRLVFRRPATSCWRARARRWTATRWGRSTSAPAPPGAGRPAARRAILENPQDAEGYFQLGLAYRALRRQSDEHFFAGRMPLLEQVRQVQTVAALHTATVLDPDHVGPTSTSTSTSAAPAPPTFS